MSQRKKINWKYILFPILGTLIVAIIIVCCVIFIPKHPPNEEIKQKSDLPIMETTSNHEEESEDENENIKELALKYGPIEMETEYKINTNVNDLKRIYINQRYYEDININGVLTKNLVDRKTNYDIFVISETESDEETKFFYNKTYTCAIAIASECISIKDEFCLPKKFVDLIDQDYSSVRNLNQVDNLKDIPLPLCLFNMTDNNVILSIACHNKLTKSRVNSIVLDLYFFRPPGIKRIDKNGGNITISQRKEGDYEYIRETNGGMCDVENSIGSFCTTDMNTTKDKNGNLIAYNEFAFSNITTNEDNYYIKKKTTNLLDKTEFLKELNPNKFNETLNKILPHLNEHLEIHNHFSNENFKELYYVSKGLNNLIKKKRRLAEEAIKEKNSKTIIFTEELFNYSHYSGIQLLINLQDNLGLNTQKMEAASYLGIDDNDPEELGFLDQYSNMTKTLNDLKTFSIAGNNLAKILYKIINKKFDNITNIIENKFPTFNNLVVYKELTDIFDSTFSLSNLKVVPLEIIKESENLINKLEEIYNGIENGSLKKNIRILNEYIYSYITQSHILIDKISRNLKDLKDLIKSPKETLSIISTYYLNHTSTSYINTIQKASEILMNYYQNEVDLIVPEVEKRKDLFKNNTIESIQKQIDLVKKLYQKIINQNLTITDANDDHYEKIKTNLENSNNYISKIIEMFQKKVDKELELKNGYFISAYDIESNNNTFKKLINDSLQAAQNFDDNEYIDKVFDEIMTDFRLNFSSIMNYMKEIKESKFVMDENTLRGDYFQKSEQDKINNDLNKEANSILININHENNLYMNAIKENVSNFLTNNKEYLDNLMKELEYLFSEKIEQLAETYEIAFSKHTKSIEDIMDNNKLLTNTYFNGMNDVLSDNNKIVKLLENTPVNKALPPALNCYYPTHAHCWKYTRYVDLISTKSVTQFYYNKYNIFKSKYEVSKQFINDELYSKILEEYKNAITNFKQILQTFKSNKMSDKYPEYKELFFIDDHLKKLDDFYNSLNKHISDNVFNTLYIPKINQFKEEQNNKINQMRKYIDDMHNKIKTPNTIMNLKDDFCTTYQRKKTYTCNNGAIYYYTDSGNTCLESFYTDNYKSLIIPSFNLDINFEKEFNNVFSLIKQKINNYNSKINELKTIITSIEPNIINMNIVKDYLSSIKDKINSILNEKYSDNLIRGAYSYYKNLLDNRLQNTLNDVSNAWINSFDILGQRINSSLENFKYSISELGLMSLMYESLLNQNISHSFHESIINHQKSEFNYTISYYYNCLIQNVTSLFQSIYNQIPTNQVGFNNITNLRRKEINDFFNKVLDDIKKSKKEALNYDRQIYILDVSSDNFFKTNAILTDFNSNTSSILHKKGDTLYKIKNGKSFNEFAVACRFYLENSLNGWQIEEYYKPINNNLFIYLNKEKFKELLKNNWIFDQDEFVNTLNLELDKSNLEINNDFMVKKEEYREILDKKISDKYSKSKIEDKVDLKYSTHLKEVSKETSENIKNNIKKILDKIKNQISKEKERLEHEADSFSDDFSTINTTIDNYKTEIYNRYKEILDQIVYSLYEDINNIIYNKHFKVFLDEYVDTAKNFSLKCEKYDTLKTSYNIGEIMYELVTNIVSDYQEYAKIQIEIKREKYLKKLYKETKLEEIKKFIDDEINKEYSNLFNTLKKQGKSNTGDDNYDFNEEIKNSINLEIKTNIEAINNTIKNIKEDVNTLGWEKLDYSNEQPFKNIQNLFKDFIINKINIENSSINKILKKIIANNFNKLINNFVYSFGKEYFERLLKYNENFRITNLYQNLKYSLVISLQYYLVLYNTKKDIATLTKDLKFKLYNLNDLDLIADEKNMNVLNSLNNKIDDFIEDSSHFIVDEYKKYLQNDEYIQLKFTNKTINSISNNVKELRQSLENSFTNLLNEEFKNKFIDSYTKKMNSQTNEMIESINELKIKIKSKIDDLFSLDIEKVLNETNYKMNMTLDSIKEYESYFKSFKLPENLLNFFDTYGDNIIQRAYDGLETLINFITKNETLEHLDKNIDIFEKSLKSDNFDIFNNEIYMELKKDIFDIIKHNIDLYGIKEYPNRLNDEIDRLQSRRLRRLNGNETEEDRFEEITENLDSTSITQNLNQLLNKSEKTINYFNNFEGFDKFNEMIEKNIKKLNISYKESKQIIDNAYSEEDMYPTINNKSDRLYQYGLNYYYNIQTKYNSLKKYIEDSLNNIDQLINQCASITYETFIEKYENISKNSIPFDIDKNSTNAKDKEISQQSSSQNSDFTTKANIISINENARFKYNLILEGDGKMKEAKIIASVMNKIKPLKAKFEISEEFGNCGKNTKQIEVLFDTVNFTSNLFFDSKYNAMNVSKDKDFIYEVTTQGYQIGERDNSTLCDDMFLFFFCYENSDCESQQPTKIDEPMKETIIIQEKGEKIPIPNNED